MGDMRHLSMTERLSHYRNLVVLALKDGKIEQNEEAMLRFIAGKWGLSGSDVKKVMDHPDSVPLKIPADEDARFQELYDLTEMMIIDEVMKPQEKELVQAMAVQLGYKPEAAGVIIKGILEGNHLLSPEETTQRKLKEQLKSLKTR